MDRVINTIGSVGLIWEFIITFQCFVWSEDLKEKCHNTNIMWFLFPHTDFFVF